MPARNLNNIKISIQWQLESFKKKNFVQVHLKLVNWFVSQLLILSLKHSKRFSARNTTQTTTNLKKTTANLVLRKKKDTTKHHLTMKRKTKNKGSGRGGVLYHTLVGIRKLSIGLRSLTLSWGLLRPFKRILIIS